MYRNLDPIHAYDVYSYDEYIKAQKEQSIAEEMYNVRHDAMERIDAIVHPEYACEFIRIFCESLNQGNEDAEILAKKIGLKQEHIYALIGDEKEFGRLMDNNMHDRDDIGHEMFMDSYI